MKGLAYFDNGKWYSDCNYCGQRIEEEPCWVYEEGETHLTFCGIDCIEKFFDLNKLQDVGGGE